MISTRKHQEVDHNIRLSSGGAYDFIYNVSKTKDPRWNIGDNIDLPDGRGFVYCKSGAACWTGRGNIIYNAIPATGIDYAKNVAEAAAVGDMSVLITNGNVIVQTEDGLAGGFILLKTATGSDDSALQQRKIIGNSACNTQANTRIYLDAPLTGALTTDSFSFCMPSPFSDVRYSDSVGVQCSHIGPAATYVPGSGYYFWCQYKGRCWLAPQSDVGATAHGREVVWRYDGSIGTHMITTESGGVTYIEYQQHAGYIVDNNNASNGATEICLKGSI